MRSKSNITIQANAVVQQTGNTTNGEAINVHGYGNTITNNGTIYSKNGAAIWFQDTYGGFAGYGNNTYGIIKTDVGNGFGNVIGSSAPSSQQGGVNFINRTGAQVQGSLVFGGGDDSLTFEPDSVVTGNIDGGLGTNALTLTGTGARQGGILCGYVKNFDSLTKNGTGVWEIRRPLQGFKAVDVVGGLLSPCPATTWGSAAFSPFMTMPHCRRGRKAFPPIIRPTETPETSFSTARTRCLRWTKTMTAPTSDK